MSYLSSILPNSVSVRFQGRRCFGMASSAFPAWYVPGKTIGEFISDETGFDSTPAGFEGTKQFHDRAIALYDASGGDPTNKAALDDLAERIAQDYYYYQSVSFDEAFADIINMTPNGLVDQIQWDYRASECGTRVMSAPYNAQAEELMHHDPANADCVDQESAGLVVSKFPLVEMYSPKITQASSTTCTRLQLGRTLLGLIDGFLTHKYSLTDTLNCDPTECPPGSPATYRFLVRDNCFFGTVIEGATVTVTNISTGAVVCTGTTDASGFFFCDITVLGTYNVVTSKSGYTTVTDTLVVASSNCGHQNNIGLSRLVRSSNSINVLVQGCFDQNFPGVTVSVSCPGGFSTSGATDGTGHVILANVPTGGVAAGCVMTISESRFNTYTGSVTAQPCTIAGYTVRLPLHAGVASGYHCWCSIVCPQPMADTLNGTDSRFGAFTMTYDPVDGFWKGQKTVHYPGDDGSGCPASDVTIYYEVCGPNGLAVWTNMRLVPQPPPFPALQCPGDVDSFGRALCRFVHGVSFSCPPAFELTGDVPVTEPCFGVHQVGDSITLTE